MRAWPAGLLVWTGETDRRVRDIMADDDGGRTERDEAAEWLTGYLIDQGGEGRAGDVIKAARADGIAERRSSAPASARESPLSAADSARAPYGCSIHWGHIRAGRARTQALARMAPMVARLRRDSCHPTRRTRGDRRLHGLAP